jgi:hypothetical protein
MITPFIKGVKSNSVANLNLQSSITCISVESQWQEHLKR